MSYKLLVIVSPKYLNVPVYLICSNLIYIHCLFCLKFCSNSILEKKICKPALLRNIFRSSIWESFFSKFPFKVKSSAKSKQATLTFHTHDPILKVVLLTFQFFCIILFNIRLKCIGDRPSPCLRLVSISKGSMISPRPLFLRMCPLTSVLWVYSLLMNQLSF